tara:strand:+ start:22769 stop:23194 length:426 start_codon:yes stop_codon:yes gene_type:complete
MKKKLSIIIILFLGGLLIIYWNNVKTIFKTQKVHIVFDLKRDVVKSDTTDVIFPKKFILNNERGNVFGIHLSQSEDIFFDIKKLKEIEAAEIDKLNVPILDSVVNLLTNQKLHETIDYYILFLDENDRKYMAKTIPSYTIY